MTPETVLGLAILAFAASITPGPNTALLAASGARFGMRRSLPHMFGVSIGFPVMLLCVGFALGEVFRSEPLLREALRWGGAAILLWLAWKIATAPVDLPGNGAAPGRPFTFLQAAGFQWINPKAWILATAVTAQFITPEAPVVTGSIVAGVFVVIGLVCCLLWAGFGLGMARLLHRPERVRLFNLAMAALLAVSVAGLAAGAVG